MDASADWPGRTPWLAAGARAKDPVGDGHRVAAICRTLGMARQTAYHVIRPRPEGFYRRPDDETVLRQIRAVTNSRASYGYRRVWAMVNRACGTEYNPKRIRRVMRMNGLMLPPRVHRRHGRPHLGEVQQPASNQRFCSDIFQIPCWSGEVVSVGFVIDCHDREVLAHVAAPLPRSHRSWLPRPAPFSHGPCGIQPRYLGRNAAHRAHA